MLLTTFHVASCTSAIYTLQASDSGKIIKARVTFPDVAGNEESLISVGMLAVVLGVTMGPDSKGS